MNKQSCKSFNVLNFFLCILRKLFEYYKAQKKLTHTFDYKIYKQTETDTRELPYSCKKIKGNMPPKIYAY